MEIHQLEQAVYFERYIIGHLTEDQKLKNKYRESFSNIDSKIEKEIIDAEKLAHHGIEITSDPELQKYYLNLEEKLKDVEKKHKVYKKHVDTFMNSINSFSTKEIHDKALSIEAEEDALTKEIAKILYEVKERTEIGALNVERFEKNAIKIISGNGFFVFFAFILFGHLISSSTIEPIGKCLDKIKVVAGGDYKIRIELQGKDEITELDRGINHMAKNVLHNFEAIQEVKEQAIQAQKIAEDKEREAQEISRVAEEKGK